ncbi:hypothetical protein PTTG_03303 [Puccinia triticina 1-1 BBBD Race 1]|uniref:Uncharacterized protein n=1 Tax=Puccinia triticina (isolate 1-1 / race 1 (BBBD)) TaxID=630390 RepID=A0A0C4ER87_PUCT1|nr:hypothetical protein PTTG_03303 [Puccinia triticina 1-1 BBBD Race 1]
MKGMIQLYAFVKALERDHAMTMRGIPIRYGSQLKKQVDVSESIGWTKPTKRQQAATKENNAKNDGRPPNTTDLLLGESQKDAKCAKTGRPPNSTNIDRNRRTTYASYTASKVKHLSNRCWLSAALESFTSLGKMLTAGLKSLFDAIEALRPDSFRPGNRTDPAKLITLWSTDGLAGSSGLHCPECRVNPTKKGTRKAKKIESPALSQPQKLEELSVIQTPESKPPAHLHFHIETAMLLEEDDQHEFMSKMD